MADENFVLICNIPSTFHSSDLRSFFSEFVETDEFLCFHFRHRSQSELLTFKSDSCIKTNPLCCLIKCKNGDTVTRLLKKYHLQNWVGANDMTLKEKCVAVVVLPQSSSSESSIPTVNVCCKKPVISLGKEKLASMIEMKPPPIMVKGNVGTPTKHFLNLIKTCQLPSVLIKKLGLTFPRSRTKRYGNVPFDYGTDVTVKTSTDKKVNFKINDSTSVNKNAETDDEEEEWDRHEALHDDVTDQERTKERLYEEEMETVWEKGGPGLVWYTDAQVWDEAEGDFDEKTSDDWDVDYSVYFEDNAGDKDARDALEMRNSNLLRQGKRDTVFKKPTLHAVKQKDKCKKHKGMKSESIGSFEKHTKGIGHRIMQMHGWKAGQSLGRSQQGITIPIESDGQKPRERKGLGYFGEELRRFGTCITDERKSRTDQDVIISTIYDNPKYTDPRETLLQRNPTTALKYR